MKKETKEGKENFTKKPVWLLIALIAVALAIFAIESQKPNLSVNPNASSIDDSVNPSNPKSEFQTPQEILTEKSLKYSRAQEIVGIERWINSNGLKISELRGKVILVDFWTYSCINCIRTIPYLKAWHEKYEDDGLVIIGIHTPEFNFEKQYDNVLKAATDYGIKYPVAMDNNYATWQVYKNRYWPRKYLIDVDGFIRYDHIGEGAYEETEKTIQALLNERMQRLNSKEKIEHEITPFEQQVNYSGISTPEIYFGSSTRGNLGNLNAQLGAVQKYSFAGKIAKNTVYTSGEWKTNGENHELVSDSGEIIIIYNAKTANIVAESSNSSRINVMVDNQYMTESAKGNDITILEDGKSIAYISDSKLYSIANARNYGEHFLSIKITGKGFRIYTFTFG